MERIAKILILPLAFAALIATVLSGMPLRAQEEPTLDANRRVFGYVGPGLRAIRRGPDGLYYVLAAPALSAPPAPAAPANPFKSPKPLAPAAPVVLIFDSQGQKRGQIPPQSRPGEIVFASSLDLDPSGRVYIADQSGNSVSIYNPDGRAFAHVSVPEPTQIVALPGDRFAVCSATADRLIAVYDLQGKRLREFGELADLSDDVELNHRLNTGYLASDKAGNLYFAFRYLPEPTVRKYDSASGSLLDELALRSLDLQPMAQSARQEIARAASGRPANPHEIISGFGVDPETQEFWMALGNLLMHFDSADHNTASSRVYTTYAARMVPNSILVEKNRLLLGNDPLGIYDFSRSSGGARRTE